MLMSGRIIPTIFGKGVDFQGLGHCPLLGLLTVPWNCLHLLTEDQGIVLSAILGPI